MNYTFPIDACNKQMEIYPLCDQFKKVTHTQNLTRRMYIQVDEMYVMQHVMVAPYIQDLWQLYIAEFRLKVSMFHAVICATPPTRNNVCFQGASKQARREFLNSVVLTTNVHNMAYA